MKKMTIEQLLTWAFCEELPKVDSRTETMLSAAPSSWAAMGDMIALGTIIDKGPNCYGVVSAFTYEGEAHPDALAVGDCVKALASLGGFEVEAGWNPFPEWHDDHGLISAEVRRVVDHEIERGDRLNGRYVVRLVTTAAIMKQGPAWQAQEPKQVKVSVNGKDAWFVQRKARTSLGKTYNYEDNGYSQRSQRPVKGAYQKWRLTQPLRAAIVARMDWQLWQSALENLHARLASHPLTVCDLQPFYPDRFPWLAVRT